MSMEIKQINLFPFKSLRGIELSECEIDDHGFKYDRIYMLVYRHPSGEWTPMTQRNEPAMARIVQNIEGEMLTLSYENGPKITFPLDISKPATTGENISLNLWDQEITSRNITTPDYARFFVEFFNRPKYSTENLAVVAPLSRRELPKDQPHTKEFMENAQLVTSSFQDQWPCTLMTTASYNDLEQHVSIMDESAKINCNSFRMNLLVDTDEPWVEDDWVLLNIGGHEFNVDTPTERCPMPSIDQEKGEFRKNRYPLPALNRFRILQKGKTPCFGINMLNKGSGYKLKVGDKVEILKQMN